MATASAIGTGVVKPGRVLSVDVLRGLTIALMILVNDPGDWGVKFTQLEHAEWNGWTLTDTIFPTFLFLVGASIVFSMRARDAKGDCWKTQAGHIFVRAVKLEVLAWALTFFPKMHWAMRWYGVLNRIAICYLIGALILLAVRNVKALVGLVAVLLVGYWLLLRFVKIPGVGHPGVDFPFMDPMWNLEGWIDRAIQAWTLAHLHTGELYHKTYDPEGLLSTITAVATVLVGGLMGTWMLRPEWTEGEDRKMWAWYRMMAMGTGLFLMGTVWAHWFPVNKNLWTSTFVLVMAGVATVVLALLRLVVDDRPQPWPRWLRVMTWPWFVFGSNAMAAFTIATVLAKMKSYFTYTNAQGNKSSVGWWIYKNGFARHGSTNWTSLEFAVCFVLVCFLPVFWMWRKKIFWRM